MVAWPTKNNSNNSRVKVASKGDIGRYLTVPSYGRLIRLNASGLEENINWNAGDTPSETWAAFWIVEIWVHEDKKNEPIRTTGATGIYQYWNPEYGWGSYLTGYDISKGGVTPIQSPDVTEAQAAANTTTLTYGSGTSTSIYTNPVSIYKVPTLSSPGSSSLGVAVGGYVGFVTNVDAYGVTVTAALGKTSFETIQNIKN